MITVETILRPDRSVAVGDAIYNVEQVRTLEGVIPLSGSNKPVPVKVTIADDQLVNVEAHCFIRDVLDIGETLYGQLNQIVKLCNDYYTEICNLERHSQDEIRQAYQKRKMQFIYDYAATISNFITNNIDLLQKDDMTVLDLVPYIVWMKTPARTQLIVKHIWSAGDGKN